MRRQSWPDVRVACVWIAQLPLRVEILRHPAWDGRPLVLGGAPGERKVVQLCSPEAEAAGVRSTGIGCYFDDEMHGLLGIAGIGWQSLYHFTTGGPVEDTRLSTLPPYAFQP